MGCLRYKEEDGAKKVTDLVEDTLVRNLNVKFYMEQFHISFRIK